MSCQIAQKVLYVTFCVCVAKPEVEPAAKPAPASVVHGERRVTFAIIAVVVCVFTVVVVTGLVCVYWRYGRFMLALKLGGTSASGGYTNVRTKKRVVVMHSNILYHSGTVCLLPVGLHLNLPSKC